MWLLEGDQTGCLPVSIDNALINPSSPCVPVRMINTQSESVVKGTKVGVVEKSEGSPSTVAVVEPSTGESAEKGSGRW